MRKPAIISFIWVALILSEHYIDKYLGGIAHFIAICSILILFIVIVTNIIRQFIRIYKSRRNLSPALFLPIIIYVAFPLLSGLIDPEKLESKVVLRGCYEGTQNQAFLLFRQNNTFELNWTGVFFYDKWYTGHWEKKGDTILLQYNSDTAKALGNKLMIDKGYFKPVGKYDTIHFPIPMFYVGNCKHEN